MAEGWARQIGREPESVQPAGIKKHGKSPEAAEILREVSVDDSGQESTGVDDRMLQQADFVVTVRGHADELRPVLPPGITTLHWPLTDPAKATGSKDQIIDEFRATRNGVWRRVRDLLDTIHKGGAQ